MSVDSDTMSSHEGVKTLSVRELVETRVGERGDPWNLSLVQRALVWDALRMRYLLDSLLREYPIGSLLVCRVAGNAGHVLAERGGHRAARAASSDDLQLLDGQQRINALYCLFTQRAEFGSFLFSAADDLPIRTGPRTSKRAQDSLLKYILWCESEAAVEGLSDRDRRIDLSRIRGWSLNQDGPQRARQVLEGGSDVEVVALAREIDPALTAEFSPTQLSSLRANLSRLLRLWWDPRVPVHFLRFRTPWDVLEVFTRLNRAGVNLAGDDLFFAAVKTQWPGAEYTISAAKTALTPIVDGQARDPLMGRMAVLRLLARLASWSVRRRDMVPLSIDRLGGDGGRQLIHAMETIAQDEGPAIRRMGAVANQLAECSKLGFGLYSVDDHLFEHVLAWASVHPRADDAAWLRTQQDTIDGYLLGATAWAYRTIFDRHFVVSAMREALAAGVAGEPFPLLRICEVVRARSPDLRWRQQQVEALDGDGCMLRLADRNPALFLSLAQGIPYERQEEHGKARFDWDHIYPRAQASLMRYRSTETRRHNFHKNRKFVGSTGNLWALDAGLNRAAKHSFPEEKFALVDDRLGHPQHTHWEPRDTFLLDDEKRRFASVGRSLSERHDSADEVAMATFRDVVESRAIRLTQAVMEAVPEATRFALDSGAEPRPSSPSPDIGAALGLAALPGDGVQRESDREPESDPVEQFLARGADWGIEEELRGFILRMRALGLGVRAYTFTIWITPPDTRSRYLVLLTAAADGSGELDAFVHLSELQAYCPGLSDSQARLAVGDYDGQRINADDLGLLADRMEHVIQGAQRS